MKEKKGMKGEGMRKEVIRKGRKVIGKGARDVKKDRKVKGNSREGRE